MLTLLRPQITSAQRNSSKLAPEVASRVDSACAEFPPKTLRRPGCVCRIGTCTLRSVHVAPGATRRRPPSTDKSRRSGHRVCTPRPVDRCGCVARAVTSSRRGASHSNARAQKSRSNAWIASCERHEARADRIRRRPRLHAVEPSRVSVSMQGNDVGALPGPSGSHN
jgi:hypothetical protein